MTLLNAVLFMMLLLTMAFGKGESAKQLDTGSSTIAKGSLPAPIA